MSAEHALSVIYSLQVSHEDILSPYERDSETASTRKFELRRKDADAELANTVGDRQSER